MKSIKYDNTVLPIKIWFFRSFFFILHFVPSSSSSPSTGLNTSDSGPDTSQACMTSEDRSPWNRGELQAGNIAVTKNDIPCVSIGADHACEHLNKLTKIHSGLVGISTNVNARQRFFLVTPEFCKGVQESVWLGTWQNQRASWPWVKCCQEGVWRCRQRQPYWNVETHLLLKVRSCTIWSLTPTSLMSIYH